MTFNCEEQLGGIAELSFYLLEETSNWPVILTDQNSAQVIINPTHHSVEATVKPDIIKLLVNKKQTAEGIVHQMSIKIDFITRSEALEQLLDQYQNKPGIVVSKMNNEFQKIYGSNLEPLYMIYEVNEGDKVDSESGTMLEIKGESRSRPVFYTV